MTSYSTFTKNAIGNNFCNPDGTWCGECVSFARQYMEQVHGVKTVAIGNACDYYNSKSTEITNNYTRIKPGQEQVGDILCWKAGATAGEFGHIGIMYAPGKVLSQNYNYKKYAAVDPFFPQDYQGALRFKGSSKGDDDVITSKDTSLLRSVLANIKGWNYKNVMAGKYDKSEMDAWVGKSWTEYLSEGTKEGATYVANREKALAYYAQKSANDKTIADLKAQLATSQLSEKTLQEQAKADAETITANTKEIADLEKQLSEKPTPQSAPVDEQKVVESWLVKLWNSLFKKG